LLEQANECAPVRPNLIQPIEPGPTTVMSNSDLANGRQFWTRVLSFYFLTMICTVTVPCKTI